MCLKYENKNVHVLQVVGDPVGGIRKHVHSILKGLKTDQFKQSYAYSTYSVDAQFQIEINELDKLLEGRIIPLDIRKRPDFFDLLNLWKLGFFIKRAGVDIIHGHGAKGGFYARFLGRLYGLKVVYTPHGGTVHRMFSPIADRLYSGVEKWLYPMTDYFIFESNYSANAYITKFHRMPQKWMVNYNGIDPSNLNVIKDNAHKPKEILSSSDTLQVGVFGMLRPQKGQMFAVKAVAELKKRGEKICLHLFGDGPDYDSLVDLVNLLGIKDCVLFHGEKSNIESYIYQMDLILIPSLFESFGYVAIEAMALGKYIIASEVGGLIEIIQEAKLGTLIPPSDTEAIVHAVIDFKNHQATKKSDTINALPEKFTSKVMLDNLSHVYNLITE